MSQDKKMLPIIPITETVIFPGIKSHIYVNKVIGENIRKQLMHNQPMAIALTVKKYDAFDLLKEEDFYKTGVLVQFLDLKLTKEDTYLVEIETTDRVEVQSIENTIDGIVGDYTVRETVDDLSESEKKELVSEIKSTIRKLENFHGADGFVHIANSLSTLEELMGVAVPIMQLSVELKQQLLSIDSLKERALSFVDDLNDQINSVHMRIEAQRKYNERRSKEYRKMILREQIGNMQSELDNLEGGEGEEKTLDQRIRESDMPEEVKEVAFKELKKLNNQGAMSSETATIQNYIEYLLEMPWTSKPTDIDIKKAREILDSDHYGIEDVKKRIIEHLAVMKLKDDKQGSILLLVGPPGTGKTSLGRSIAKALERDYVRVSLGGVDDESEIRGHRRTYVGAMAGRIIKGINTAGSKNPVFILDEIDKLGRSYQGDPSAALLEVLDPEQNGTFQDHYLDVPYDLSEVFFIATANDLSTIPAPLLDRTEVIELSSYTNTEKFHIAKEHLVKKTKDENGISDEQLTITDDAIRKVIDDYTAESGVRGLTKQLSKISRVAAQKIVTGEMENVEVTEENITDFLGKKTRRHEQVAESNLPGVVTGMAWTAVGGEILFTEASFMPGSGKTMTTGQLGDVMTESANIAMSLIRSRLEKEQTGFDFAKHDLHIHVPAGATPKDGPSAGVTLTTAIASLILGIPVDSKLAMTGEISLSGKVLPVGGIKEKVIAAHRSGIKTILLPKDNEIDIEDIPEEVRNELEFKLMETIDDVFEAALGVQVPKVEKKFDLFLNTQPHQRVEMPSMIL